MSQLHRSLWIPLQLADDRIRLPLPRAAGSGLLVAREISPPAAARAAASKTLAWSQDHLSPHQCAFHGEALRLTRQHDLRDAVGHRSILSLLQADARSADRDESNSRHRPGRSRRYDARAVATGDAHRSAIVRRGHRSAALVSGSRSQRRPPHHARATGQSATRLAPIQQPRASLAPRPL